MPKDKNFLDHHDLAKRGDIINGGQGGERIYDGTYACKDCGKEVWDFEEGVIGDWRYCQECRQRKNRE